MSSLFEVTKRLIPASVKPFFPESLKRTLKAPLRSLTLSLQLVNADARALPKFIIVGAQKCGTTTLYTQLGRHPAIFPTFNKETNYFTWNFDRGLRWYRAHFPVLDRAETITGEASPYYIFHPHSFRRIAETLPNVRIIVLLRNPVDRAYSSFQHQVYRGREKRSFEDAIEAEQQWIDQEVDKMERDERYFSYRHAHFAYVSRGVYVDQVEHCFEYFEKDQVLIIESECLFKNNSAVFAEVLEFLGISQYQLPNYENVNKKRYAKMKPATRDLLIDFYRPFNARLYELLGCKYEWDR